MTALRAPSPVKPGMKIQCNGDYEHDDDDDYDHDHDDRNSKDEETKYLL